MPSDSPNLLGPAFDTVLAKQDRDFVECAYRSILHRAPDSMGFEYYLRRLRSGELKLQILAEIAESEEARGQKTSLTGLDTAIRLHKVSKLPLLGTLLRLFFNLEGSSLLERRLRAAEQTGVFLSAIIEEKNSAIEAKMREGDSRLMTSIEGAHSILNAHIEEVKSIEKSRLGTESRRAQSIAAEFSVLRNSVERCNHNDVTLKAAFTSLSEATAAAKIRQEEFETRQLPTILETVSDLNRRQVAAENGKENLARSVPVALRKLTRDVLELQRLSRGHSIDAVSASNRLMPQDEMGMSGQTLGRRLSELEMTIGLLRNRIEKSQEIAESLSVQYGEGQARTSAELLRLSALTSEGNELAPTRFLKALKEIDRRHEDLQKHISEVTRSLEQRIGQLFDHNDRLSRFTDQRFSSFYEQRDEKFRAFDQRLVEMMEDVRTSHETSLQKLLDTDARLGNSLSDVSYLMGRVEFVRRELMFEMRYGAHNPSGSRDELKVSPTIVSAKRLLASSKDGIRLNLGCGHVALPEFLNVDRRALPGIDIIAEVDDLPFEACEVQEIFSSHLIEHFTQEQLRRELLGYWFGLLKPGGHFRAVAPDADAMLKAYHAGECPFEQLRQITFGGQDYDGDFHYNMLNAVAFTEMLKEAGYVDIRVIAENRNNGLCKEFEIAARKPEKAANTEPQIVTPTTNRANGTVPHSVSGLR